MNRPPHARTRLAIRFLVYYALAYLVLILLMGVILERSMRSALLASVDEELEVVARLALQSLPQEEDAQGWAARVFDSTGFRTTLITIDGIVVADSHSDPAVMEDHSDREEVVEALAGEVGEAQRISESTGFEQRYVALPPAGGLIVRTSAPTRVVNDDLAAVRGSIALTGAILGVLGVGVVALLTRHISRPIGELTRQARAVAAGEADTSPRRSAVRELDQLGEAIASMGSGLGSKLAEAEQATATLEVVLGALPAGTVLFDGDDGVAYANRMARRLLGVVPEHLTALTPLQFQELVRQARETGETATRVVDHGVPARRLQGVATPFRVDGRVLLLVSDITERERADSIRRDFVANASHELKTPVATIIAASETLRLSLERGDGSAVRFAEQIEASARQLDRLVGDLLDLSRLEREVPEKRPVRLDGVVAEEVERVRDQVAAKGVVLEWQGDELVVEAAAGDVAIAVRNLLDNAIRHTPPGGSIAVSMTRDRDQAVITVTDTGEGIPSREIDRIFERFYRVDSARSRATGGTGLGLAIVKHVAESHGGSVAVRSELGAGSSFTIRLPLPSEGETSTPN